MIFAIEAYKSWKTQICLDCLDRAFWVFLFLAFAVVAKLNQFLFLVGKKGCTMHLHINVANQQKNCYIPHQLTWRSPDFVLLRRKISIRIYSPVQLFWVLELKFILFCVLFFKTPPSWIINTEVGSLLSKVVIGSILKTHSKAKVSQIMIIASRTWVIESLSGVALYSGFLLIIRRNLL